MQPDPWASRAAQLVVDLPSRLPLLFFWLTLVVSFAVLLGVFRPLVVLSATLLVAVLLRHWAPQRLTASRATVVGSAAALLGTAAWVAVGLRFTAQVLLVERDPGFLTLEGLWLSGHADPDVPIRSAADVIAQIPGARASSDAFWLDGHVLTAQGAKAFPGVIATLGWAGGQQAVLAANVLIGGLALLAMYDVARRLLSPLWGLLPVTALALSTPMLYFTRTPFTEPANVALTFAGLAVLWDALRTPRVGHFALAGGMLGATALARIDGAAVAAGLLLGLGVVAAASRDPARRRSLVLGLAAAAATALSLVALGYLDVRVNSPGYLAEHRFVYLPLVALLAACTLAAVLAVLAGPRWLGRLDERRPMLALVGLGTVLAGAVLLASRPLWWEAHRIVAGSDQAAFVAAVQQAAGVAVDGTRSYDEQTVTWLAWYLGPVTVVLAAVGAAFMVHEAIARRRASLVVLLATLGVPALLYLVRPSITPDQIWAMRRFLPAALPLTLLCAAWLLWRSWAWARDPERHRLLGVTLQVGVGAACVAMLTAPTLTWGRLVGQAEYAGRAAHVAALCDQVRDARVVVVRGAEAPLLPTLRIVCDVDVVEIAAPASSEQLAAVRAAWAPGRVLAVGGLPGTMPGAAGGAPATMRHPIVRWPHSLTPAVRPVPFESSTWVGEVGPDGSVQLLPPIG